MLAPQLDITHRLLSEDRQFEAMEARIAQYLRTRSGVTLVELARDIPGFFGDLVWGYDDKNIVIWQGMSRQAIATMQTLLAAGEITTSSTSWLVYNFEGQILCLPIAKRPARYKTPHWLPVVFSGKTRAANDNT